MQQSAAAWRGRRAGYGESDVQRPMSMLSYIYIYGFQPLKMETVIEIETLDSSFNSLRDNS